jgi:hypothetical protein
MIHTVRAFMATAAWTLKMQVSMEAGYDAQCSCLLILFAVKMALQIAAAGA